MQNMNEILNITQTTSVFRYFHQNTIIHDNKFINVKRILNKKIQGWSSLYEKYQRIVSSRKILSNLNKL
jgi:hypothetical protein